MFTDRPTMDRHRSRRSIHRAARTVGAPSAQDALVLLGPDHPLARAEVRIEVLWRQVTAVGVLLSALGVAAIAGAAVLPAVIAAAVVEATLLSRRVLVAGDRRGSARDLIAAGRADLPVAAVQRELVSVIALLREPRPDLAVIARVEGLLSSQSSPLYGDDATRLRDELLRIAFLGRELRPGSRSSASGNRTLSRTLLAFVVAAIVATTCTPAASASTARDAGSACHTFQRFHETWRLCPDATGSLQRQRIGVLP